MRKSSDRAWEDPMRWISRLAGKLYSNWLAWTYPFYSVGKNLYVHWSCDLKRSISSYIKIGDSVRLDQDVWINIPTIPNTSEPVILFDDGCIVGRRCVVSAKNRIHFGRNVICAPSVLVMDHNHAFDDVTVPIKDQGVTEGGTIRIEEGCWIGSGVAIICSQGELVVGRNSVVAANSLVTRSIPAHSVVVGNPGQVINSFNADKKKGVLESPGARE